MDTRYYICCKQRCYDSNRICISQFLLEHCKFRKSPVISWCNGHSSAYGIPDKETDNPYYATDAAVY